MDTVPSLFQDDQEPGKVLLSINVDVALWLDWRRYCGIPSLQEVRNFVIVSEEELDDFEEFKANNTKPGICDLVVIELLEYYLTRVRKECLPTTVKFGKRYVQLSMEDGDRLITWVDEMRERYNKEGLQVFQ